MQTRSILYCNNETKIRENNAKFRREKRDLQILPMPILKDMASGALGMAVASIILNPLDVIKVRIQSSGVEKSSMVSCARQSMSNGGGLFRGLILPGLTATAIRDILNGAFRIGMFKEIECFLFRDSDLVQGFERKLSTGLIVGATGAGLWSHTDLIKTRMQLQNPRAPAYRSTVDAYRNVYRHEGGLRGLYRGVGPNMIRAGLITTAHVSSYDYSKSYLGLHLGDSILTWTLCGFFSALVTTTVSAPIDLIRTRIMAQSEPSSIYQQAGNIIQSNGFRGLLRGWMASFTRFGPHFTISWPLIELSRKYIFGLDSF
jgi:dicarboxylate transporter 10